MRLIYAEYRAQVKRSRMKVSLYNAIVYTEENRFNPASGYLYCPYPYLHSYLYLRLYCDKYIRVESTKSSAAVIKPAIQEQ